MDHLTVLKRFLERSDHGSAAKSWIRAHQQYATATFESLTYRAMAKAMHVRPVEGDELRRVLRERMAHRSQGRWPKRKGEMHLFLAYSVRNWEAILPAALRTFGEVTVFDWGKHGIDANRPDCWERRDQMNRDMIEFFLRVHEKKPVDAVIGYMSGINTTQATVRTMRDRGAAVFNFSYDDVLSFGNCDARGRFRGPAAIAAAVDLNLTNSPSAVIKYAVHGGLARFFPEAAHPDFHRPLSVPFEIDVAFAGARYGWRPHFMSRLGRLGVHVECFGPGWSNGPLSDEEMIRLYSRARINLGISGVGHSMRLTCLKGRDFEVPMSGGLYLTQNHEDLPLVYDVGREILAYRDVEECAAIIKRMLRDPTMAAQIRTAGRTRALRDHTYDARWSDIFRLSGLLG